MRQKVAERVPSSRGKPVPISVAVTRQQRRTFQAEARRRGLGISSTIRTLALERTDQLRDERQLTRARRWQLERLRALADRVEAGSERDVTQAEIDALFDADDRADAR